MKKLEGHVLMLCAVPLFDVDELIELGEGSGETEYP